LVTDIGTPSSFLDQIAPETFENNPSLWQGTFPHLQNGGNKYTRGHALIWGGYPMTGAARLAARSAARIGAGLTTIAVPAAALDVYATALTSIMVHPVAVLQDFAALLADERILGLLIGPGAGVRTETRARALAMLGTGRVTVLDADHSRRFKVPRSAGSRNNGAMRPAAP
jgi:NAD(P)H-hydrate epimerase